MGYERNVTKRTGFSSRPSRSLHRKMMHTPVRAALRPSGAGTRCAATRARARVRVCRPRVRALPHLALPPCAWQGACCAAAKSLSMAISMAVGWLLLANALGLGSRSAKYSPRACHALATRRCRLLSSHRCVSRHARSQPDWLRALICGAGRRRGRCQRVANIIPIVGGHKYTDNSTWKRSI